MRAQWPLQVRHGELFFPYRGRFLPAIVNSLSRLGLPGNAPLESRKLAADLALLIIKWEQKRRTLAAEAAAAAAAASAQPDAPVAMDTDDASRKRGREEGDKAGTRQQQLDGTSF